MLVYRVSQPYERESEWTNQKESQQYGNVANTHKYSNGPGYHFFKDYLAVLMFKNQFRHLNYDKSEINVMDFPDNLLAMHHGLGQYEVINENWKTYSEIFALDEYAIPAALVTRNNHIKTISSLQDEKEHFEELERENPDIKNSALALFSVDMKHPEYQGNDFSDRNRSGNERFWRKDMPSSMATWDYYRNVNISELRAQNSSDKAKRHTSSLADNTGFCAY